MANVYRLRGYDPFSSDYYDLGGEYSTHIEAENAARNELQELEVYALALPAGFRRQTGAQVRLACSRFP